MPKRKRPIEEEEEAAAAVRSEAQMREAFVKRNRDNRFINPNLMQLFALQLATPFSSPKEQDIAMQTAKLVRSHRTKKPSFLVFETRSPP